MKTTTLALTGTADKVARNGDNTIEKAVVHLQDANGQVRAQLILDIPVDPSLSESEQGIALGRYTVNISRIG